MIFHPVKIDQSYKYRFNANFEELFFEWEGARINALHFRIENPKGVILYFHGNSGSLDTWGLLGEVFTKKGYDFFIFDYRGYGKSTGSISEKNFHKDSKRIYDHLKNLYGEERMIVYGMSLGSGFAVRVASQNKPKHLILEAPYFSFKTMAEYYFPFLPLKILLRWNIRTDQWIQKVKCPITIFHGTEDEVIPYKLTFQLAPLLKKEDSFITIIGARHNNIPSFQEYEKVLAECLK
jgi:alpha-beta hydrolase superfamily lysophospholipase